MLAIDTNLIVRYLTGDHPRQSAKAKALIDGNDVFVCTTVLLEAEWYRDEEAHGEKAGPRSPNPTAAVGGRLQQGSGGD